MININLQSEYVISIFGFLITNTFLTTIVATIILSLLGIAFYKVCQQDKNSHILFKSWHIVIFEILRLSDTITQDREISKKLLPLVATLFLFIFTTNLIALLPGFLGSFFIETSNGPVSLLRSPNSDLTTTVALACITVFSIQFFSLHTLGIKTYFKRFINISGFIPFTLGLFEAMSESMRILSFSFRLFGNVFAGEVLLLVIAFLVPYILPVPFMILEVFISLIQAYIFCILTLTFIRLSSNTLHARG